MKATEHRAPVRKVDRINLEILLSVSLLNAILLLVEIHCGHGFRKEYKTFKELKVRAK